VVCRRIPYARQRTDPGDSEREGRRCPAERERGAEDRRDHGSDQRDAGGTEARLHAGPCDEGRLHGPGNEEEQDRDADVDGDLEALQQAEHGFTLRETRCHGIRQEMYPANPLPRITLRLYCPDTG